MLQCNRVYSHMTSTYGDMFAVCAIALLCLMSVSRSAPLDCKDVVRPLDQLDPRHLEGRWALVAESMKVIQAPEPIKPSISISVDFYNSTFIQANRYGDQCQYSSQNITLEGNNFTFKVGQSVDFSGTFFHTSCVDCVVFSFAVESPTYKTKELLLFSKRREVDQNEMREFITQVECLKMPGHVVMDPNMELCPVSPHLSSSD